MSNGIRTSSCCLEIKLSNGDCSTMVNGMGGAMKPGKYQRSKKRHQGLFWKVHDRAQPFVLRSYTMHELRNQNIFIG